MILEKYYNRDVVNTFTSITLFIISIVSANLLIRLFQKAYSQGLGIDAIAKFVILTLPENVTLIAPIAIFLAIILCFGKFFANNEMFVTLAGGVTWSHIVKNAFKPVYALSLVTLFTTMYLIPLSKQTSDIYQSSLSARALLSSVSDSKIIDAPGGRTIYIGKKSGNELKSVYLYQKDTTNPSYKVITAPKATISSNKNAAVINFKNLNIYTEDPRTHKVAYGTAESGEYEIYDNVIRNYNHTRLDRLYLGELIKGYYDGHKDYMWQIFHRLNNCISVIVAGLIALAMCRLRPRQNKYAKLLPSVVVLAIYLCSVMFINTLMDSGSIPVYIGIWLPHIVFVIFGIRAIRIQNGSSIKRGTKNA